MSKTDWDYELRTAKDFVISVWLGLLVVAIGVLLPATLIYYAIKWAVL